MHLSSYQEQIINWVETGTGHGCCNAVAGSGKSTTLRLAAKALEKAGVSPNDIKICVFGKANALDLIAKFGEAWQQSISTLHSAGWSLLKNHLEIQNTQGLIKSSKYKLIAQDLKYITFRGCIGELKQTGAINQESDFLQIINLLRLTNQEPMTETIEEICLHFEIEGIWEKSIVAEAAADILKIGERQAKNKQAIDFADQIWLPVKWGLRPAFPYKFVLVDECQDLNAAQLELVLRLAGPQGRILAVGDPRQAIMGFAGADNRSYYKIVERLGAVELPLSICYRCPSNVIDLVKLNFPEIPIEANPTASTGKIESIEEKDLWDANKECRLVEGDMAISRKTAPLVSLCIKLIARGIAATVKGKSIGNQIKGDLQEIAKMPGFTYENFNDTVKLYKQAKAVRYAGLENEDQLIELLNDKLEALQTIYSSNPQANCIQDLANYIDSLFSDEKSLITLSTCHRAKGLEGERIFIIKPQDLPMTWRNQQDWQLEQEYNLLYVALTRSKSELYIVGNPSWLSQEKEPVKEGMLTVNSTVNSNITSPPQEGMLTVNNTAIIYSELEQTLINNPQYSNRYIAEICGVSAPTVAKYRCRLKLQGLINSNEKRIAKNGRLLNTQNIGREPAPIQNKILEMAADLSKDEIKQLIDALGRLLNHP